MLAKNCGRALARTLVVFAMSALLLGLAAACGVSFGATEDETEIFKGLSIDGDFRLGGAITYTVEFEQPYAVAIEVRCELLDADAPATATTEPNATPTPLAYPWLEPTPANKVEDLLTRSVPANPGGGLAGEATPVVEIVEYEFNAPTVAGRYRVRCYTPFDENNAISKTFTIEPILAR